MSLRIAIVTDITQDYHADFRVPYIKLIGSNVETLLNTYPKSGINIGFFWIAPGGQVSQYGQWQVHEPSLGGNSPALLFARELVDFDNDNIIPPLNPQADEVDAAIEVIRILKKDSGYSNALLVIANGKRGETQTPIEEIESEASSLVSVYAAAVTADPGRIDESALRKIAGNLPERYGVLGEYNSLDGIWRDMVANARTDITWNISYEPPPDAKEVRVGLSTVNGQIDSASCLLPVQAVVSTATPTSVTEEPTPTVTPDNSSKDDSALDGYLPYIFYFIVGFSILWFSFFYLLRRIRNKDEPQSSDNTIKRGNTTRRDSDHETDHESKETKKVNPPPPPIEVPVEPDPASARLVKLQGAAGDEVMWLDGQGDITKFGRAKEEVDKVIENDNISRSHFKIEYKIHDDSYYITDNDSANGTFVNGEAITGPTKLQKDAEISLHVDTGTDIVYRFERPEPKSIPDPHTAAKGVTKKVAPRATSEEKQPPPAPEPEESQSQADKRRTTKKQKPAK